MEGDGSHNWPASGSTHRIVGERSTTFPHVPGAPGVKSRLPYGGLIGPVTTIGRYSTAGESIENAS